MFLTPAPEVQLPSKPSRRRQRKFGYIVAASNNSRNGPMGGSSQAMNAMWQDTQQRFPIAEQRRYVAGMSGGARVATSIALSCRGCVAGVIANAAGFPFGTEPTRDMKFAYYAAVGNADFNYGEFVDLRRKLDAASARYRIRIFEGQHGWAPPEVWIEALNWMDIQAMSAGTMPRDQSRIQQTLAGGLAKASEFQSQNNPLAALREYQSLVRDFRGSGGRQLRREIAGRTDEQQSGEDRRERRSLRPRSTSTDDCQPLTANAGNRREQQRTRSTSRI